MSPDYFKVLFLDKQNSTYSLWAEKLLQHWGGERFKAYSAGVEPSGTVDPITIQLLHSKQLSTDDLSSKSWDAYLEKDGPHFDFVITLAEKNEIKLPEIWKHNHVVAHWNLDDAFSPDSHLDEPLYRARQTYSFLENRIKIFSNLKLHSFSKKALARELDAISNYKLNDELLDNEHELFFFLSQRLTRSIKEGKPQDTLINIAQEIQKYAQFHFFSEENYMEEMQYPGLQEHSELHAKLMSDLNEKVFKCMAEQVAFQDVATFLEDWFLQHTLQDDSKFTEFLAQKTAK